MSGVSKEQMSELTELLQASDEGHVGDEETTTEDVVTDESLESADTEDDGASEQEVEADEVTEQAEAATDSTETEDTYSPAQLAKAIGWETSELYDSVMIPMDDGQAPVSLGEMKNTHQNLVRDYATLQTKMDEQGGVLQQAQTGQAQGQQMSVEMIRAMGYLDSITRMEEGTNWAELESDDPTEAVLKRQKFQSARSDVEKEIQSIRQKQHFAQQTYLKEADTKMRTLIPAWSDDKAMKGDQDTIRSHMKTVGFGDNEINAIGDPRIMVMLKELIDLRAEKGLAKDALKKVRNAPKLLAGGRRIQKKKGTEVNKLVKQAHRTGSKKDELNAVKGLLKQNYK